MYCRPVYYKGLSYVSYVRRTLIQSHANTIKGPSYVLCSAANHPGPTPSPTHINKKDPYRVTCKHLLIKGPSSKELKD